VTTYDTQAELAEAVGRSTASMSRDIRRDDWPVAVAPPWDDTDVGIVADWLASRGVRFRPPKVSYIHAIGWTADKLIDAHRRKGLDVFSDPVMELGAYLRNYSLAIVLTKAARRLGHTGMPDPAAYEDDPDGLIAAMPAMHPDNWRRIVGRFNKKEASEIRDGWNLTHYAMEEVRGG